MAPETYSALHAAKPGDRMADKAANISSNGGQSVASGTVYAARYSPGGWRLSILLFSSK
jgi:hypothetical protein